MKTLEKGSSKIQKICDALKYETLEPAKAEATAIIKEAADKAEGIIEEAKKQAKEIIAEARKRNEQERNVFNSSLEQAAVQGVESLRQSIEKKLFNKELHEVLEEQMADPKVVAKLIDAIVISIEKEGVSADINALIPKVLKPKDINGLLIERVVKNLENQSVQVGDFVGGTQVKLKDRRMTIDITEETLKELLARYVRKDFRKAIFAN